MSWVKLDDRYFSNGKIRRCSPMARLLHVASMCHCAAALNDGEFPAYDLAMIQAAAGTMDQTHVEELVAVGLWDVICNVVTNAVTAYRVHDFLEYNPPASRVIDSRAATKERVRKWRESQGNAVTSTVTNAVTNAVSNTAPLPLPDPRPKPTKKRAAPAVGSEAFEAFWAAFPAHRRVKKPEAIKAWPGDEHAPAIMAHVEALKRKDGGEFIQQTHRYLREETWKVPVFDRPASQRQQSFQVKYPSLRG